MRVWYTIRIDAWNSAVKELVRNIFCEPTVVRDDQAQKANIGVPPISVYNKLNGLEPGRGRLP